LDTLEALEYAVTKSATFLRWLKELRDKRARARIAIRIDRVQEGNFGDHKAVGGGVSELRIPVGQGYRVYYTIREGTVVVLLCGGNKSSQPQDIRRAQRMAIEV
jgi:putative addiction module killer protein